MTLKQVRQEFRITWCHDTWGHVMHWWFTIADELHWNRRPAVHVPQEWYFQPSIIGPSNDPDDYATNVVQEMKTDDLLYFGNVLHRYAKKLDKLGRSY